MIVSALATLLIAVVAMAPGIILCRGGRFDLGRTAALATASLAITMMATTLVAVVFRAITGANLPAWWLLPVSLAMIGCSALLTRGRGWQRPQMERAGIAVAAIFVLYGLIVYAFAVTDLPDGSLRIHAWYNADWFKHIGHTYGIADHGLPARDIFGAGHPLRYYWLSHVLPGAGTTLGGDAWAALYTANAIYAALLTATLFGAIRLSGASSGVAAVVTVLATMVSASPLTWAVLLSPGGYDALLFGPEAPLEPALISLALYIPQHALALALLLGWAVLMLGEDSPPLHTRLVALAALATVMTVSTLFGATLLVAYGLVQLCRRRIQAFPELSIMAIVSILLVLVLGIVKIDASIASSTPTNSLALGFPKEIGAFQRGLMSMILLIRNAGLPLLVCLFLVLRWKPEDAVRRNARGFVLAVLLSAFGGAILVEIAVGQLIAHEVRLRVLNLIGVAVGIIGGWAISKGWSAGGKRRALAVVAPMTLILAAAPTMVVRTLWHGNTQDSFNTIIPRDDRAVLAVLKAESGPRDVVWQYPEKSFLSDTSGHDNWSVVLAGRTNVATPRATDRSAARPFLELAQRYFAGEDVPAPASVGWVYLSRKLHPSSFDELVSRLGRDEAWLRVICQPNACLFRRMPKDPSAPR